MELMMAALIKDLLKEHGLSLLDDEIRFKAFLKDHFPGHNKQINLLCLALAENIITDIQQSHHGSFALVKNRLVKKLVENLGLAEENALWVVNTYAYVLEVSAPEELFLDCSLKLIKFALKNHDNPEEWVSILHQSTDKENPAAKYLANTLENNLEERNKLDRSTISYDAETIKLFKERAKNYSALAYLLGNIYDHSMGVEKDYSEAFRWYKQAAEKGDASAMNNLGIMYNNGEGTATDLKEALRWYKQAAEEGHAIAMYNLGNMYYHGNGVAKDLTEAFRWYEQSAEKGDCDAMFKLGNMYFFGEEVWEDYLEAFRWYKQAAEEGHAIAMYNLGNMYYHGNGVAKDLTEAFRWYKQAAEKGDCDAMCDLGFMYNNGEGVAKDLKEALRWYEQAAEEGHAIAMFNLGIMYYNGEGVAKDLKEALRWYEQAAEEGHAVAMFNLGVMYDNGEGITKDLKEAIRWYRQAADLGEEDAMFILGNMYYNGNGVAKDLNGAIYWYKQAADRGNKDAREMLDLLNQVASESNSDQEPNITHFDDNDHTSEHNEEHSPKNAKKWLQYLGLVLPVAILILGSLYIFGNAETLEKALTVGAQWATDLVTYSILMIIAILVLSIALFFTTRRLNFTANLIIFAVLCIIEIIYVFAMGGNATWFCMPYVVGWGWAIVGFILFGLVVYNQITCYINILEKLEYYYEQFSWRLGVYSWPAALLLGIIVDLFNESYVPVVAFLFLVVQIIQIIIILVKVVPKAGLLRGLLCVAVYLIGAIATMLILIHFLVLLIVILIILLLLSGLGAGSGSGNSDRRGEHQRTEEYWANKRQEEWFKKHRGWSGD